MAKDDIYNLMIKKDGKSTINTNGRTSSLKSNKLGLEDGRSNQKSDSSWMKTKYARTCQKQLDLPRFQIQTKNQFSLLRHSKSENDLLAQDNCLGTTFTKNYKKINRDAYEENKNISKRNKKTSNKSGKTGDYEVGTEDTIKKKVHIYADSHGKDLGNLLNSILPKTFESFVCASSGAKIDYILKNAKDMTEDFTMEDTVVIIAGANNFSDTIEDNFNIKEDIPRHLHNFLDSINHTNIVYVSQFHRHDQNWNSLTNQAIYKVNYKFKKMENLKLISISDFKNAFFTRQGQHLNKRGKRVLCRRIVDFVLKSRSEERRLVVANYPAIKIKILNENMRALMMKHCNNEQVAFAHCISSDFDNKKQMSAGVAVEIRKMFGRPSLSDYCGKHLTYQKTNHGTNVYSMVTKPKYYLNVNNCDNYLNSYDIAFTEMTENFKTRNLKTLICSPMGCVRDHVPPFHFITNLLKFQKNTGAEIIVVVHDEGQKGYLRNRLSHTDFIQSLVQSINVQYKEINTDAMDSCLSELDRSTASKCSTRDPMMEMTNEQSSSLPEADGCKLSQSSQSLLMPEFSDASQHESAHHVAVSSLQPELTGVCVGGVGSDLSVGFVSDLACF